MSGGKGGSTTANTQIPDWLQVPAQANLARAEQLSRVGYMPYYGPEVAAFTPMQQQSMQNTMDMAAAFGLAPQGVDAMAGVPGATDYGGGIWGYSSGDLFDQALAELAARRPGQAAAYAGMFDDPYAQPAPQITAEQLAMMGLGGGLSSGSGAGGRYRTR